MPHTLPNFKALQDEQWAHVSARNQKELQMAEVTHHKLTNQTVAQDSLETRVNKDGASVNLMTTTVDHETRKGSYVRVMNGLLMGVYFIGLGRNKPDQPWRVITELVA